MDTNDPAYGTAVGHGYCVGDRVELHSLKGAAEHNGKRGTVTGAQNDRIKVKLDGDKSLALKLVNLTKLDTTPPKPKPAAPAKPPPRAARFTEPAPTQKPQSADARFTDFFTEDKKEAPTSDDAEILAMEANIKEYKAQEKRRAIKAAKARAARQERAMKAKIIEERAKKQQQEAEEVWVDGRRVDEKQSSSSSDEDCVDELHDCKPTKKKSWFNWGKADEDVALTADELAYAGDFGTDEEARVQRKLVPKRPRPTDWEELQSKALAVKDCPVPREDPEGAIKFLSRRLRRSRDVSSSCRAWFAVHELLAAAFLRLKEQSVSVLKSALYHDERCLEGVAKAGRGPLDAERPRIERRAAQTCGKLGDALKRKGLPPAQRRSLCRKECELADLAAENSRYVDDDELAKVARIAALELKGTAYLRLCRLEQADADAGEARLPPASLKALGSAVEAFEEACKNTKTADGDALARFGASLEARAVASRKENVDPVELRRALEALGAACDSDCRTGNKKEVQNLQASTALYAARVAFHLLNRGEDDERFVQAFAKEVVLRAAHSASLKPSLEADFLEAAGSLKEDSDYGRKTALKALERARAALQMEMRNERPKENNRKQDAERAKKRGDREAVERVEAVSRASRWRFATLYRETERALGLVANRLGNRKMAADAWERACAGVDSSCRSELKKRPDAATCTNLELGAIRSLMKDHRGSAEAYERACEASQRVAALASMCKDQKRCERAVQLCKQASDAGVSSTITAIQQEYKKCKWDFSEGKWLKVRGTADALLLLRLAEGKLAAERALKLGPCVHQLKDKLDAKTLSALRDLENNMRKASVAAKPALVASTQVSSPPAPPRLEVVRGVSLAELAEGPALLRKTASLIEADADVEQCSWGLERLSNAPHLSVQLACGPRDARGDLESILQDENDVVVSFFVSGQQLIGVAFGDKLKTARLFVSTYDPSIEKTVEQAMRARGKAARSSALDLARTVAIDELRDVFPSAKDWAFCLASTLPKIPFHALPLANGASLLDSVVVRYGSSVAELAAIEKRNKVGGTLLATIAPKPDQQTDGALLEHASVKKGWRCAKVTIPAKSVPAMVMDAEGQAAGADLLDANMVYWSTASIDDEGLKLKEQNWEQTFPSLHLCAIKELLPACDCLFILKSTGDVSKTSDIRSALHLTGASSVVLPSLQAPPLSTDGKEACLLRALVMLAFLKYLRKHEQNRRGVAHALRDAQRWLRDSTLQDARKILQRAPLDPTEKKEFATSLLDAFSDLNTKLAPDLCDWAGFSLSGSGSGLQGAGWTEKDNNYVLGNDDSSEDSEDEDADAGDKYFAAQFDEFCNTRDGRRLVRELGPEKALKQWKQKVARDKRAAATQRALAGARSGVTKGSAKARAAARRAKAKAIVAGGAVRLAAEKQKSESGACVVS